jgi:hypothetical protein
MFLQAIRNNLVGLDLTNSTAGYCNENVFIGGRFGKDTGVNPSIECYGVRITSKDLQYRNNNNNNFFKPSFELKSLGIPVIVEHGAYNKMDDCRNEGNSLLFAKILNESIYNVFNIGYGNVGISDLSDFPTSFGFSRIISEQEYLKVESFKSGSLSDIASESGGVLTVPNYFFITSSGATLATINADFTLKSNSLQLGTTRLIAKRFTTDLAKRFLIKRDVSSANPGRVVIRTFDASMTHLTTDVGQLKGKASAVPLFVTTYGGAFRMGSDTTGDFYFEVSDDVKYIDICLYGDIFSYSVYSDRLSTGYMI